eukprot:scaffold31908_cov55-Cyclotella_meneghiniana.AAC.3
MVSDKCMIQNDEKYGSRELTQQSATSSSNSGGDGGADEVDLVSDVGISVDGGGWFGFMRRTEGLLVCGFACGEGLTALLTPFSSSVDT